jgi:hypothetical protein
MCIYELLYELPIHLRTRDSSSLNKCFDAISQYEHDLTENKDGEW